MKHGKIDVKGDITLATGATADEISTDGTLGDDSDTAIPTEKAVKTYADTKEAVANKDTDNTLSANSDVKYPSQKAIKSYVDSISLGLDWQESVLDRIDLTTAEPVSPSTGDRYINTVTGTSNQTTQSVTIDGIYEWNGSTWTEALPNEGFATWVEDEDVLYVYNGSSWVKFGSTVTHANLIGLQGGTTNEFYHLTSAEHTELVNWIDNVTLASNGDLTLANGTNINEFSIDGTLVGNSDDAVPTEKAIKTYVDAEVAGAGGDGLSNVIFSWSGQFTGATGSSAGRGIHHGTSLTPTSGTSTEYHFIISASTTFGEVLSFKWVKISSISTITMYANIWVSLNGDTAQCRASIGGQLSSSASNNNTTPTWQAGVTVDVSGLTNGTLYDGIIQLKNSGNNRSANLGAVTLIAS